MSWILDDPDWYEVVVTSQKCTSCVNGKCTGMYCNGSTGYSRRMRSLEEYSAIKERKRKEKEDQILAEADTIRASRGLI